MAADDEERTYSIWPFLVGFVVLAILGGAGLLLLGSPSTPTATIPAFASTTGSPTTTDDSTTTTVPVTVPGGDTAPDGVSDVVADGDVTSYAFALPSTLAEAKIRAVVARAEAVPDDAGTSLIVSIRCSVSSEEALAQISVTESDSAITVLPVVVAAADAPDCSAGTAVRQITLPLRTLVGARGILLAPAGTAVPAPAR